MAAHPIRLGHGIARDWRIRFCLVGSSQIARRSRSTVALERRGEEVVIGTIVLLAYGLLPESLRFSRAIFLFGAGFVPGVIAGVQAIFTRFGGSTGESAPKRLYISDPWFDAHARLIRTHDVLGRCIWGCVRLVDSSF